MSGPNESEGNSLSAASGARASACFLCRREIQSLTGTGTKYDVNGCAGLSEFLLGEGFLALSAIASPEEVCRWCHSDLMQLEELLNKEKEIRNQMIYTAKLIKIRVRQSSENRTGDSEEEVPPTDSDSEDSELLSIHSEDHNPDPADKANDAADKEDERFPSRSNSNPKSKPQRIAVQGEDYEEERPPSDSDEENLFERISVHSDASVDESSSSSEDEDDDDQRSSPGSKPNRRAPITASATKAGPGSMRKRIRPGGPYPCEVRGCKAIFTNKDVLYAHFRTHNHRPFRCHKPSCNSAFSTPYDLKAHATNVHHNGQRPFRCDVAGCEARFHTLAYLNSHRCNTHKGQVSPRKRGPKVGPYPCEVTGCKALLKNKTELYTHFRVHNHRPFRCHKPFCNSAFYSPARLTTHLVNSHPVGRPHLRCDEAGCGSRFHTPKGLYDHHYIVHSRRRPRRGPATFAERGSSLQPV